MENTVLQEENTSVDIDKKSTSLSSYGAGKRYDFGKWLFLTIFTLGIYDLVFVHFIARDVNKACYGDGKDTPGLLKFILLSIVTLGIYGYVWYFAVCERMAALQKGAKKEPDVTGTSWILWAILGSWIEVGPFIAQYKLMQALNSCNAIAASTGSAEVFNRAFDRATKIVLKILTYLILVLGAVILVFPFVWMLLSSFKTGDEATLTFTFFPKVWTTENYKDLFSGVYNFPIFKAFGNTVIIEVSVIIIGTFVSAMAAFSFAKLKLRHKTFWLLFLMSGMMVPYAALMLPQYRAFETLGMLDTLWPLILPGFFGNVSMIFFLIQYMKGVPNAYFEAARIDGANHFTCFLVIMFPLVKTAIAAQVIFWFVGIWNDYFAPSLYLTTKEHMTLQVLLGQFTTTGKDLPMSLAGALLASIPMFIIYISCQKFFIESLAISGVKG